MDSCQNASAGHQRGRATSRTVDAITDVTCEVKCKEGIDLRERPSVSEQSRKITFLQ